MAQIPEHLRADAGVGLELAKESMRPGRLKICQANRSDKFAAFEEGDLIVTPAGVKVASAGEPFYFVPLFFYMEWATVNPHAMKATLKMIRERTLDPRSPIAVKARDPEKRGADACPENTKMLLKHVEYLNFIVAIVLNEAISPVPVVMTFCRGEHGKGSALRDMLAMRADRVSICANVLQGVVPEQKRVNDQGQWYGIDVGPPTGEDAPAPFVMDPGEYTELKKMSDAIKKAHAASQLIVDIDEDEEERADEAAKGESRF